MALAISETFLLDFARLDRPIRERVGELIHKFRADPSARGLNLEKPTRTADQRSRTLRVDQNYRAVVLAPERGDTYLLLGVFAHDDAYDWCARNRIGVNAVQGAIEVEDVVALDQAMSETMSANPPTAQDEPTFFAGRPDKDFVSLGIEERFLPLIRAVRDERGALTLAEILPSSQGAALSMLAADYSPEDAWAELVATEAPKPKPSEDKRASFADLDIRMPDHRPDDIEHALAQPASRSMFYVLDNDEDLHRLLNKPLALWRVFLHPSQERVALRPVYNGPARVSGGPGTGKTVVLLHRARMLSEQPEDGRILVTTFTRNLATDLASLLVDLAGESIRERIDVLNIDAVVQRIVRGGHASRLAICSEDAERTVFEEAVAQSNTGFAPETVRQEWRRVVLGYGIHEESEYLETPRPGRSTPLDRARRIAMWRAIQAALRLLGPRRTFLQLADEAARLLLASEHRPYAHVLVDEAQDLHPAQLRFLRALVAEEPNDLFLAGDTHQRIYAGGASFASLGIDIRGRSTRLNLNYRSTQEILKWAMSLLHGEAFEDLDGNPASLRQYRSRLRGPEPRVRACATPDDELQQMVATVDQWIADGVEPKAIAVTARTRAMCQHALEALESAGVPSIGLTAEESSYGVSAAAVATMHRLKGLEFRCVAVIGCSEGQLPPHGAVTPEEVDPAEHRSDIQRERSVLYVACTRARDDLVVSWAGRPSSLLPDSIIRGASR